MIQLITSGIYSLIETKNHVKVLTLDTNHPYVWIYAEGIGEILVLSEKQHKTDHILSNGKYRLYSVKNEPDFTDLFHLELFVGNMIWQGYLLPLGFPTKEAKRHRIIPTHEIITRVSY